MLKKQLCFEMLTTQNGLSSVSCQTLEVCNVLPLSTHKKSLFTYVLCIFVLIYHSNVKKSTRSCGMLLKFSGMILSLAIAVVVMPHSSYTESFLSVHGEKCVYYCILGPLKNSSHHKNTNCHTLSDPYIICTVVC